MKSKEKIYYLCKDGIEKSLPRDHRFAWRVLPPLERER